MPEAQHHALSYDKERARSDRPTARAVCLQTALWKRLKRKNHMGKCEAVNLPLLGIVHSGWRFFSAECTPGRALDLPPSERSIQTYLKQKPWSAASVFLLRKLAGCYAGNESRCCPPVGSAAHFFWRGASGENVCHTFTIFNTHVREDLEAAAHPSCGLHQNL